MEAGMPSFRLLNREWKADLSDLIRGSKQELLISTPYISKDGVDFVTSNLPQCMTVGGRLLLLTDLSPMPICQGSTDPSAIRCLAGEVPVVDMFHLPKLHAKVYVSDTNRAIVTSGNLTRGGLDINYEYGIAIDDPCGVASVREHLMDYTSLGAAISMERLLSYCEIAAKVRTFFREEMSRISNAARGEFRKSFRLAEDELIKLHLAEGPMHAVFSKAVLFFLKRHGPLKTTQIHGFVEDAYPALCDNSIDRVIDGVRYGKRWKHGVRTAQQHLKKRGLIEYFDEKWRLSSQ